RRGGPACPPQGRHTGRPLLACGAARVLRPALPQPMLPAITGAHVERVLTATLESTPRDPRVDAPPGPASRARIETCIGASMTRDRTSTRTNRRPSSPTRG